MKSYIFILGRDPELSRKELFAYLKTQKVKYTIKDDSDIALILELPSFNSSKFIKDLAGTQKIGVEIDSFDNLYEGTKNKARFAVSNYTKDESMVSELKNYFKKEKIKATIKKSHHQEQEFLNPSEATSVIEIIQYKGQVFKSIAVFNPREYKARDLQRPVQRPLHTISIRLAKFLINLSEVKKGETLLDPFCGIGTILQESLLMDINVIGIDKDHFCIDASKKNLDWLKARHNFENSFQLYQLDSRSSDRKAPSVDVVATEPYMGPFLKNFPTEVEAKKILNELIPLYRELLVTLQKITKKNIVIITPIFRARSKKHFKINLTRFITSKFTIDEPILYTTPTSKMHREIWVLRRK